MKHGTGRRSFEALIAAVRFGRHAVIGECAIALKPEGVYEVAHLVFGAAPNELDVSRSPFGVGSIGVLRQVAAVAFRPHAQ